MRPVFVARLERRIVECVVEETWHTQGDDVVGAFIIELGIPVFHVSPSAVRLNLNFKKKIRVCL